MADGLRTQHPFHNAHNALTKLFTHPLIVFPLRGPSTIPPAGYHPGEIATAISGYIQDVHSLEWPRPGCWAYHYSVRPRIHLLVVVPSWDVHLTQVAASSLFHTSFAGWSITMDIQQWGSYHIVPNYFWMHTAFSGRVQVLVYISHMHPYHRCGLLTSQARTPHSVSPPHFAHNGSSYLMSQTVHTGHTSVPLPFQSGSPFSLHLALCIQSPHWVLSISIQVHFKLQYQFSLHFNLQYQCSLHYWLIRPHYSA